VTVLRTSRGEAARARVAEVHRRAARASLAYAVRYLWPVKNGSGSYPSWGYHLDAMCEVVEAFVLGKARKAVLNVPPGVGKSSIASRTAGPWAWLQDSIEAQRHLYMAHKVGLAHKLQDDRIAVLRSARYRHLMPRGHASWGFRKLGTELVVNTQGGQFEPFSSGQSPTGDHYDRHIYDDPHGVGDSALEIAKAVEWLRNTASTRFRDEAAMAFMLIMQRVSTADATAALLDDHPDAVHLCLPMEHDPRRICDLRPHGLRFVDPRTAPGELLPAHGKGPDVVARHKRDARKWATQYQQSPVAGDGNVFDSRWFQRWRELAPDARLVGVVDATMGGKSKRASALAVAVWALQESRGQVSARLVDLLRLKASWTQTERAVLWMLRRWPTVRRWLIEEKKFGVALVDLLRNRGVPVIAVKPEGEGDKEQRAAAVLPLCREGLVHIPSANAARPAQLAKPQAWIRPRALHPELARIGDLAEEGRVHEARLALVMTEPQALGREAVAQWEALAGHLAGEWAGPDPWLTPWLEEHRAFPNAGDDDQVDTTTMALGPHPHALGGRLTAALAGVQAAARTPAAPAGIEVQRRNF